MKTIVFFLISLFITVPFVYAQQSDEDFCEIKLSVAGIWNIWEPL